jgi:hypothetical protein
MRMRRVKPNGLWAAGIVLSLVSTGCGDDATDNDAAKVDSNKAGASGGEAAVGGSGDSTTLTKAECISKTNRTNRNGCSAECLDCACDAPAHARDLVACDANCWAILKCSTQCGPTDLKCVEDKCAAEISIAGDSALFALPVDSVLRGETCASKCVKPADDPEACD